MLEVMLTVKLLENVVGIRQQYSPKECVHEIGESRPRLLRRELRETKSHINEVCDKIKCSGSFRKLLFLVAQRESSFQAGLRHQLNPDLKASKKAWEHTRGSYPDNPYKDYKYLWGTYGLFGMNSNYFTVLWDHTETPEILCDPIIDILVYRRAARRAFRKLNGTVRCKDNSGKLYDYNPEPNWYTIHRAVSGGKICPTKNQDASNFERRAKRWGLDPYENVEYEMMGRDLDKQQDLWVALFWMEQEEDG